MSQHLPDTEQGPAPREFVHQAPASRIVLAAGARHRIPEEVARLGWHRMLFIGGADPLRRAGEEVTDALGTSVVARIIDAAQHVPISAAKAATDTALRAEADGLIALGGGSAIGLAKAVALDTGLPILAIPTTYAGSEMTDVWGRTEQGRGPPAAARRSGPPSSSTMSN